MSDLGQMLKVRELAELLASAGLARVSYEEKDFRVTLESPVGRSAQGSNECPPGESGSEYDADWVVSPLVGKVYHANPKIKAGQRVKKGATLLVIESMKINNEIGAPRDGIVEEIVFGEGDNVAVGDRLVKLG